MSMKGKNREVFNSTFLVANKIELYQKAIMMNKIC